MSRSVSHLGPARLEAALDIRDLSDPAAGPHAIQILVDRAVDALSRAWSCEVRWCRGPAVVPVADNYDRLGYAAGAITRESRYTRYVSADRMLRSHSTAMVPPALRRLARDSRPPAATCCWPARGWCTGATPSTGSTAGPRTSSTCGGSPPGP